MHYIYIYNDVKDTPTYYAYTTLASMHTTRTRVAVRVVVLCILASIRIRIMHTVVVVLADSISHSYCTSRVQ